MIEGSQQLSRRTFLKAAVAASSSEWKSTTGAGQEAARLLVQTQPQEALWFARELPKLRAAIRPIYVRLGILQEMSSGLQTASDLTPRED